MMESENIKALLDYIPEELERLARIGKAIEKAYSKGAFLIYDVVETYDGTIEQYNFDGTVEDILAWAESEEE